MFLFFDKFMFEKKKVPVVTTCNALDAINNFFPHESLLRRKTFWHLSQNHGGWLQVRLN